jgi:hypothetical protein
MSSFTQIYYKPYSSDTEDSESDSGSETSETSDTSSISNDGIGAQYGSPLALARAGGPSLLKLTGPINTRIQPVPKHGVQYSAYDMSGVSDLPFTGTTFDTETGNQTSILIINSLDRDRNIYLQPTFFTLRVPRTYRNIVSFQILQLKLLSSFFYFSPDQNNTSLRILEYGRTLTNAQKQVVPNSITTTIRTGTYDIVTLLSELQTELNTTPLFFYFPNGITDFITQFGPTGDLSLGFNQPGDNYYDSLRGIFITNPTMAIIVSYYFSSQYAGLSSYTIQQVKYAYYYPVLYECYIDPANGPTSLNLTLTESTLLSGETIEQRILYTKQGLNDAVIAEIINTNITALDNYRMQHTFKYYLANEYKCSYATYNNYITISSSNLNTSLVNLINLQTAKALASELNARDLTSADYSNLQTAVSLNTAVFTGMYNFVQSNFATNFGINFNTYAPEFFADVSNNLFIQNGINATGVSTGYSLEVLQKGNVPITSSTSNLKDTPVYWPQLNTTNLTSGSINYPYNLTDASSIPYNVATKSFVNKSFVDNSGFVYTDLVTKSGDIVIPIEPSKYTVFRFRSPVRQNLQVETLPLPYYYRYPEYNALQGGNIGGFFDLSYSFNYTNYNSYMDNISPELITSIPVVYAQTQTAAAGAASSSTLQVQNSIYYYKFTPPLPTGVTLDASGYSYTLNITSVGTTTSGTFTTPITMFLYHDRGMFMADVSGVRSESPYHYIYTTAAQAADTSMSIHLRVFATHTYYILLRTDLLSFTNTSFKIYTWFDTDPILKKSYFNLNTFNPYANPLKDLSNNYIFAEENHPDFIKVPTATSLMGLDPSSSVFNSNLPISEIPIGYDISGISTDLTDYKGYLKTNALKTVPFATYRIDPTNTYTFQQLSAYSSGNQSYFYTGGSNTLLTPYTNSIYAAKSVALRQYKIVHWYDYNYIAQQNSENAPLPSQVATMTPFNRGATLAPLNGYTYNSSNNLQLGNGIVGFSFLPAEGVWNTQSFFFKSAWNDTTTCANDLVKYIAVYKTNTLTDTNIETIDISNAIQVMEFTSKIHYTPGQVSSNNGFDSRGGTYYTFTYTSNISVNVDNVAINGYTPGSNTLIAESSLYSFIAFDENFAVTKMYLLSGSIVPYPEVSDASGQNLYFGSRAPTNQDMILPVYKTSYDSRYSPTNGNICTSQYEQSQAIGTQVLHYNKDANLAQARDGLNIYTLTAADYTGATGAYPDPPYPPYFQESNLILIATTLSNLYTKASYNNANYTDGKSNIYACFNTNLLPNRPRLFNTKHGSDYIFYRALIYPAFVYTYEELMNKSGNYYGGDNGGNYYGGGGGAYNYYGDSYNPTSYFDYSDGYNVFTGVLDAGNLFTSYVPTKYFCTAIVSNDYNYDIGTPRSNHTFNMYCDKPESFFAENGAKATSNADSVFLQFTSINFPNSKGYNVLTYVVNDPTRNNTFTIGVNKDSTWAFVMVESIVARNNSSYNGDIFSILNPISIYYGQGDPHPPTDTYLQAQCMSVRGLNGNYYIGNTTDNTILSSNGISMSIYSEHTNTKTYILPYDQYDYVSENNKGSTLYLVDLSQPPNPVSSPIGFTQGTVVFQFTGTPNTFTNVSIYSSNIVLLKAASDPGSLYYLASSNLITSNSNYVLYSAQAAKISEQLDISTNTIGNIVTGPGPSIYVGPVSYSYNGDILTESNPLPNYIIYKTGNTYYYPYYNRGELTWLWSIQAGYQVNAWFFCYSDGTLYTNSHGFNVMVLDYPLTATPTQPNNTAPYITIHYFPYPSSHPRDGTLITQTQSTYTIYWNLNWDAIVYPDHPIVYPPVDSNVIYGSRSPNDDPISTKIVGNAWQIFYPNFKLNLVKKSNSTSPITNTTDLTTYPFYPHTSMFFYNSFNNMVSDLSGLWAHEKAKNFLASDVSSGYFFLSYINTINLEKSTDFTNTNSSYNYLAIRGYSPTEKFKCLLRFYLPGRYDFGYMSIYNLMQEAQKIVLVDLSGSSLVNPLYANTLRLFNNSFKVTSNFGGNSIPGYSGANLSFTGFSNFMTQYTNIYQVGLSNAAILNGITSNVNATVRAYIQYYLGDILPSYVLQRDTFTSALSFSIQFQSALAPQYAALLDSWGLGYNLGFNKADTPYSTVQTATSFFKILDDYIYLRLNPEFTMNRMDTTASENLAVTHEPTGITNQYAAKLLLTPFGTYATTLVQNPIQFNPTLQSLDRLSFQWTDKAGNQLSNTQSDWSAVVQIQEHITAPKVGSTIPRANK